MNYSINIDFIEYTVVKIVNIEKVAELAPK